jgi:hypothetical protein
MAVTTADIITVTVSTIITVATIITVIGKVGGTWGTLTRRGERAGFLFLETSWN